MVLIMRTIKFRGKRKDNGEFVYSKGGIFTDEFCTLLTANSELNKRQELYLSYVEVVPETVGQFTGLLDKNGNDIYVGDVLKQTKLDGSFRYYKIFNVNGGFGFNIHQDDFHKPESEIYFYESTADMQNARFIKTLETIGNIHDNPELLNQ